ncbi:hypothetical protein BV22DRAFT_1130847 [Leucogyrophana mollusca]|uniref:Uncharacterized protein n=1 Tax=Leucogyrophana mollusca TaxID=85980 RepID=A0ACB8BBK8_9AGAM|nr:hypothetical protein BV22DRAFT_1130847 [Leucogyrophana mollusca]
MVGNRKPVPAALHAELSEYAALMRAMRTSRTLDLTAHLLDHAVEQRKTVEENIREGKGKSKIRDTWTTWPLLDVHVPEWSIDEEIKLLGEQVVRMIRTKGISLSDHDQYGDDCQNDGEDSEEDELEPLSQSLSDSIVLHSSAFLAQILNLMLAQRPAAADSLQNRMWAFDWEDVLGVAAGSGLVPEEIITRTKQRLEHIYGASEIKAIDRMRTAEKAKSKFESIASVYEDTFLQPPIRPTRRRSTKSRRVVSKPTVEDSEDSGA